MREVWLQSQSQLSSQPSPDDVQSLKQAAASEFVIVPALGSGEDGPTANTTGLGLPLSRALAKSGGGWLGLESDAMVESAGVDASVVDHGHAVAGVVAGAGAGGTSAGGPSGVSGHLSSGERRTHFWCLLEVPGAEQPTFSVIDNHSSASESHPAVQDSAPGPGPTQLTSSPETAAPAPQQSLQGISTDVAVATSGATTARFSDEPPKAITVRGLFFRPALHLRTLRREVC